MTLYKHLMVLCILRNNSTEMTAAEIAAESGGEIVQGTQVVILESLEEEGLVSRELKPEDTHGRYQITPQGIKTLEKFGVKWPPKQEPMLSLA